jgi:hypothetical protein
MTTKTKNFLRHILPSHATACQDKARKSQGSFIKYIKYNDFTHATTSRHFKQWISKAADFDKEKSEELIMNNNHVGFVCNNMMLNLYPNSSHGWLYFSQPTWQFAGSLPMFGQTYGQCHVSEGLVAELLQQRWAFLSFYLRSTSCNITPSRGELLRAHSDSFVKTNCQQRALQTK